MTVLDLDTNILLSLLDNQPESVFYYTPIYCTQNWQVITDFEVAYCNPKAALLLDVSVPELLRQRVSAMPNTDSETRKLMFGQLLQVYQKNRPLEHLYFNAVLEKYFHAKRSKVAEGVLTIIRDQTQDVQVQQAQLRQMELTDRILDASINGVVALEAVRNEKGQIIDFRIVKANTKVEQLLGKREEELLKTSYLALLPPSKENGMFNLKCQVINTGQPIRTQFYYEGAGIDGWYDISIFPLGKDGVVETFTDITDSKKDKDRLALSAQRFATVVNASKAGMHTLIPVKDDNGEVIDFRFGIVNQAVAAYIGQSADVLTGALASVYFPAYMTNGLFDTYKDCYLKGESYNFDFHYKDGYDVFFQIDVTKMGEEVLVTFTDHTALKRLQRELEMKVVELGRSNANLEEFAHAASHDMKEPLRKVRTFADRLKQSLAPKMDTTEANLFERIDMATERMQHLLDDLLEFSHVSECPPEAEAVDLNEKIKRVLTDLELPIEEKHAQITVDPLPTIQGYRRQLQQLFQNLISNALKYSKKEVPPKISIHSRLVKGNEAGVRLPAVQSGQSFWLIEVKDNGIGFEQQYAEKIFDMFQRLHGKMEYTGTGIGLAIARKVVENHNGRIWAKGQPGVGATFYVLLPA